MDQQQHQQVDDSAGGIMKAVVGLRQCRQDNDSDSGITMMMMSQVSPTPFPLPPHLYAPVYTIFSIIPVLLMHTNNIYNFFIIFYLLELSLHMESRWNGPWNPWNPAILYHAPTFHMEQIYSMWNPRNPHGIHMESTWNPHGICFTT